MTITYDDKDTAAIEFGRWMLGNKDLEKGNTSKYVLWVQETATYPTIEELYQIYLKQKQ